MDGFYYKTMLNRAGRGLEYLASSKIFRAALPALLACGFCFFNLWLPFRSGAIDINFNRINYGSSLLAGLFNNNITWMMPFFETVFSFALNFGMTPAQLTVALGFAIYLIVFCVGSLLNGYRSGVLSLAAVGAIEAFGGPRYDDEQSFYSFLLLLVLSMLLIKKRDNTLRNSLLCGLAIGASLLVRTPLLVFPPVVAALDYFYGGGFSKAFVLRSLVLVGAAYILLLPWGFLNRAVSGEFALIDGRRAACNLITGARGGIYTMEGDCRKLAGLGAGEDAFGFFARETMKAPGFHALNFLKRLRHIFMFHPLLFGAFLAALVLSRGKDKLPVFCLPGYFILIHAPLSIEARYFYPMIYLLPPLIIGSLSATVSGKSPARGAAAEKIVLTAVCLVLCAAAAVETLVAAYPYRYARNIRDREYLERVLEFFPNDRILRDMKCRLLWVKGADARYYSCLGSFNKKFDDKTGDYFLAVINSTSPSALPIPPGREMECLILRMLREFELGGADAMISFRQAYAGFERTHNMLRGEPYGADRELARQIRSDSTAFWDEYVYNLVLMWPPEEAARILSILKKRIELPRKLKLRTLVEVGAIGETGVRMIEQRVEADIYGMPAGRPGLLWKERTEKAKRLSDEAVKKMAAGDFAAAENILTGAIKIFPSAPEVLMNLCSLRLRENRGKEALEACRSAAYSVYFNPENRLPDLEMLAADASFASYRLMKEAGRGSEAQETLCFAVESAPAAWPGLARARAALTIKCPRPM